MARPIPDSYEIYDGFRFVPEALAAEDTVEVRSVGDDQPAGYDGYIALWNVVDDRGTFFTPGSFKKSIKERGMASPVLWNHDFYDGVPIGRHVSVIEDDKGVRVSAAINEGVQRGAEVMSNLRFKVPTGLSFGFDRLADRSASDKDQIDLTVAPDWVQSAPRNELRAITEIRYWEHSPVTFASNPKAKPDRVRSLSADDLDGLLAAVRDGSLTPEQRSLIDQIVAANEEAAAAGQNHGTGNPTAQRNLDVEFAYAFSEWSSTL